MKKLYDEYVRVEKDKKMTHKVFFTNIGLAIVVICMCLTAMSFTAYAYFTSSITSGNNTIVAGNYDVEVVVAEKDSATAVISIDDNGVYNLSAGKTYSVTLKGKGTASVGYCKILVNYSGGTVTLYSNPIGTENSQSEIPNSQTFSIVVPETVNAEMVVVAEWGSCSMRGGVVSDGAKVELPAPTSNSQNESGSDGQDTNEDTSNEDNRTNGENSTEQDNSTGKSQEGAGTTDVGNKDNVSTDNGTESTDVTTGENPTLNGTEETEPTSSEDASGQSESGEE